MTEGYDDDPLGATCAATGCFENADTIALVSLSPNPLVGAATEDDPVVLEVPLCVQKHAHLLRMPVTSCAVDTRLS